jgi:serine/threonine protein phosphatase PrpC
LAFSLEADAMIWLRGTLEVGTPGRLENCRQGPVDVGLRGTRCVLEYLGWDSTPEADGRWRLIQMAGRLQDDGRWLLRRRADESELSLMLSEDRTVLAGGFMRPGLRESWRIVLERALPLLLPSGSSRVRASAAGRVRAGLDVCHYSLIAGQWRNGEARQRDALLLAGKVWQHARMSLRRIEVFAADLLAGLATGLPGHPASAAASRIVLDALRRLLIERPELRTNGRPGHRLMVEVQRELHRRLGRRPHGRGAGASLVVAHLRGAELLVVAIGTCRALLVRADGCVEQVGEVQSMGSSLGSIGARQSRGPNAQIHFPWAYRHPARSLDGSDSPDLLAIQFLRRTVSPRDFLVLLSPGASEALYDSAERWQQSDASLTPFLRSGARIQNRLISALRAARGCTSFVVVSSK